MGFNNAGAATLARRIMLARPYLPAGFVVGVSIGRGKETDDERAVDDYLECQRLIAPVADYLALNVSSPNTPGLRALQAHDALRRIVEAVTEAGDRIRAARPLFVKLSPDLALDDFAAVLGELARSPVDGVILSNTTTDHGVRPSALGGRGGLSGAPLLRATLDRVALARERCGDALAIIASGGIARGEDAAALLAAGADLVQLWTGLVYRGPGLIGEAVRAAATMEAA